jgi:hypothetical protein
VTEPVAHTTEIRLAHQAIQHERELREAEKAAFDHERELRTVFDTHERELRQQTEQAVEKARALQFNVYEARLDNLNHAAERMERQAATFLTIDRYEREHSALIDRHVRDVGLLAGKIEAQERVTVRQDATQQVLDTLSANRRWLYGIMVTVAIFGLGTLLHAFGVL